MYPDRPTKDRCNPGTGQSGAGNGPEAEGPKVDVAAAVVIKDPGKEEVGEIIILRRRLCNERVSGRTATVSSITFGRFYQRRGARADANGPGGTYPR